MDAEGDKQWRPLQFAARGGSVEMATALLDAGADVNSRRSNGWSALHYATAGRYYDVALLLMRRGADVNVRANSGMTPLHVAAQEDAARIAALFLLILGHATGRRSLEVLGLVALPVFLFLYYHDLQVPLLAKSGIVIASGLVLLALRFFLTRRSSTREAA